MSVFHNILEAVEKMELPEGDYLQATKIIKQAFEIEKSSNNDGWKIIYHTKLGCPVTFTTKNVEITVLEREEINYEKDNSYKYEKNLKVKVQKDEAFCYKTFEKIDHMNHFIRKIIQLNRNVDVTAQVMNLTYKFDFDEQVKQKKKREKLEAQYADEDDCEDIYNGVFQIDIEIEEFITDMIYSAVETIR